MIAAVLLRALSDGLCPAVEHPSIALATLVIATQSRAASVRAITESAFEDSISSAEDYAPFINGERGKPRREGGRKLMEWMANALKRIEIPTRNGQMIALADKPIADITTADVEAVRIHWPLKTQQPKGGTTGPDRNLKRLRHMFIGRFVLASSSRRPSGRRI